MEFPDFDILTTFACDSPQVLGLLQENKDIGKLFDLDKIDLVQEIIDKVLNQNEDEELPMNPLDEDNQPKKEDKDQEKLALNSRLAKYLYNLTKSKIFLDKYQNTLPLELYEKTIKNQSNHKYKLMLNQNLDEETINLLLQMVQEMTLQLSSESDDEASSCLEKISKLLKEDLNEASQLEDINFIKKVIVPLLHAEQKVHIRISKKISDSERRPIFEEQDSNISLNSSLKTKK